MDKELYLVFIDDVGTNLDDKFVYHFYFSETPEVVWGEFWNVCPCCIVPTIAPDIATISCIYEIEMDNELQIVTNNSCFSMQDCIDRIVSLGWFDFSENVLINNRIVKFDFGEHYEEVTAKMNYLCCEMAKIWEVSDNSEDAINDLIDKIGGSNGEW